MAAVKASPNDLARHRLVAARSHLGELHRHSVHERTTLCDSPPDSVIYTRVGEGSSATTAFKKPKEKGNAMRTTVTLALELARLCAAAIVVIATHDAQTLSLPPDQFAIVRKAAPTVAPPVGPPITTFTSNRIDSLHSAIFLASGAEVDGTPATNAIFSVGFYDAFDTLTSTSTSRSMGRRAIHGATSQDTEESGTASDVVSIWLQDPLNPSAGTWVTASVTNVATNGLTITWNALPTKAFRLTCILIGGDGQAHCGSIGNGSASLPTPFQADIIFFLGMTTNFNGPPQSGFDASFGFAARRDDGSIQQGSSGCRFPNLTNPTESYGMISNTVAIGLPRPAPSDSGTLRVTSIGPSQFSFERTGTAKGAFLALDLADYKGTVIASDLNTSTGLRTFCTNDIQPAFAISVASTTTTFDTVSSDSSANAHGISTFTSNRESALSWLSADGQGGLSAPTKCHSLSDTSALALFDAGQNLVQHATLISLQASSGCPPLGKGFILDFTTASSSGKMLTLALGLSGP